MIINYLITNIEANRDKEIAPDTQIGVEHSLNIIDVEKDERFKILKFSSKFEAKFTGNSKEIGKISVQALVVYTGDNLDKVFSTWQESKNLDKSVREEVLQASLNISILEAMSIAKILQLPSILPLPQVPKASEEDESKHEKKQKK
ncbi:hypothetical protein M1316_01360 [Candidatus Parvarchaeota archaeon]|nr:hypothetical protein [Candidatus Parvarchaeota archaeon]